MKDYGKLIIVSGMLSCLLACSDEFPLAPVEERSHGEVSGRNQYRVHTGDTLYSVAWAYNLDYRKLAAFNHLSSPYTLHLGQILWLKSGSQVTQVVQQPVVPQAVVGAWRWPVKGKVVKGFSNKPLGNKGLDISSAFRHPVYASAPGIVVYSGEGIRGYGKLLIIKHNENYLSAYAFNWRNLVKEGDTVKAGQQIAMMGRDDNGKIKLHFEIRYNGDPVNPLNYVS